MERFNSNTLCRIFITLIVASFTLFSVFGVQSFSVSTNALSITTQVAQSGSETFTITNTGDENLNLILTQTTLQSGSNTISSSLDVSSIQNLENGSSSQITFSYGTSANSGTYDGNIVVTNTNNSTQTQTISVSLIVNQVTNSNSQIQIVDSFNTNTVLTNLSFVIEDKGDTERVDFKIKNIGSTNLTNIRARVKVTSDDDFDDDDFEIEGNRYSSLDIDDLNIGGFSKDLEFEYISDDSIKAGSYSATLELYSNDQSTVILLSIPIYVSIIARSEEAKISKMGEDVSGGVLSYTMDPGQTKTLDFEIINSGVDDIRDLLVEVKEDLSEESSTKIFSKSQVEFSQSSSIDVHSSNDKKVRVKVTVPSNQDIGSYFGEIRLIDSEGDEIDTIELKIRVIDDIYINEITINGKIGGEVSIKPGAELKVEIDVVNEGATRTEDVQIYGEINNIAGSTDLRENTNNFVLSGNSNIKEALYFEIPKRARDNLYEVEIRLEFGDNILVERKNFRVIRDEHKVIINTFGLNTKISQCRDSVDSFVTVENIGRKDETVLYKTNVKDTSVSDSFEFKLGENEERSRAIKLDISNLVFGDYTVLHKITYGNISAIEETSLKILECIDINKTNVDIRKIVENTSSNRSENKTTFEKLGANSTTFALGIGLVFLTVLLVIGILFL